MPFRRCPHGYDHPKWPHACDGCWCEGENDREQYGWPHDTSPKVGNPNKNGES